MFKVELHFVESKRFRITRLIELIKSVWTRAAAEVYQMFKSHAKTKNTNSITLTGFVEKSMTITGWSTQVSII